MKTIKISSYKALSLIFALLSTSVTLLPSQAPLRVTMQWSKESTIVPINVNYSGTRIITSMHETAGITKVTFEIPRANDQNNFCCLFTSTNVGGILKTASEGIAQQNTLEYLVINTAAPYKCYDVTLIKDPCPDGIADPLCPIAPTYHFDIKEETLPETGQLPDRTIIITCDPTWVMHIKGGTQPEFTIFLDNSMTETSISDEKFKEAVIKLELAALDSNALHASTRRKIKTDGRCTRIMDLFT
jgi:hypothetical protein